MAAPGSGVSYTPAPHEQAYYDGLFQVADVARMGNIGGTEAVAFFSRSKLPVDLLKNIWTLADQNPTTSALDRRKFYTAVRLIQLSQNGQKAQGATLGPPPGVVLRPVVFEGVSGVLVPMPPVPQPQQQPQIQQQPTMQQPQMQQQQPQMQQQPTIQQPQMQQQPTMQQPQMQQQPTMQQPQMQQQPTMQQPQMQQQPTMQQPQMQQQPTMQQPQIQQPMQQHQRSPMQQQHFAQPPMQYQAPPTPPRPPMKYSNQPSQPPMSMALTAQDPYTLFPHDQSRYEALFPEYQKDGFVYGSEAVALFSKSGLSPEVLRDVWNLVDNPVDNRLDKLEFAMAMHLIVCVSKKNLPVPQGLPMSLKVLKSQQPVSAGPPPNLQQAIDSPQLSAHPSPQAVPSFPSSVPQPHMQQNLPSPQLSARSSPHLVPSFGPPSSFAAEPYPVQQAPTRDSHMTAPPPIAPSAMSISDAFEGLTASGGLTMPASNNFAFASPSSLPEPTSFTSARSFEIPEPETIRAPTPAPVAPPKSTKELAASYDQADDVTELGKLKTYLQKLQAENISLKASLGSMTQEEKAVQKEIAAAIAEIGRLSSELTTLRAQVLAAKSALLEATADLHGHQERKGMLTDLISDTRATKEALAAANASIARIQHLEQNEVAPPAVSNNFDEDLFGFDSPPPAPAPGEVHISPASTTDEQDDEEQDHGGYSGNAGYPGQYRAQDVHRQQYGNPSWSSDEGLMGGTTTNAPIPYSASPAITHTKQPLPPMGGGIANAPTSMLVPGAFGHNPTKLASTRLTPTEIQQLKDQAIQAQDTARQAEETHRVISGQLDDLRLIADQAEAEARDKESQAGKKKGTFGRGKKTFKEAEKARQEAAEKRQHFMDMQAQAQNAQTLAMESKREADRLRHEAEQAELMAASAESMRDTEEADQRRNTANYETNAGTNGHPQAEAPAYGFSHDKLPPAYGGAPHLNSDYSNGVGMGYSGGFGGIMGGSSSAGGGIPTPPGSAAGEDPYSNPFH